MKIRQLIIQIVVLLGLWLSLGLQAQAGTVTYVYTDPQGTPLAEADVSGNITARFDYAPYGAASTASGMSGAPNGPGYTGHVNDPESGFVYMQARYYDPAVGRFLSVDFLKPEGGGLFIFNRYLYANGNPVINIDADGRQTTWDETKLVPIRDSNGQIMMVPEGVAGQVLAAVQTGSNVTDITNPNLNHEAAADALNNGQLGLDAVTLSFPEVAEITLPLNGTAGVAAWVLDPGWGRAANAVTFGLFKGLKILARESEDAMETVEQAEKAATIFNMALEAQEHYNLVMEQQRERQQQQREQQQQQREQQQRPEQQQRQQSQQ